MSELGKGLGLPDDVEEVLFLIDENGYLNIIDEDSGEIIDIYRLH